jgi:predicted phage-related endonuclease
MDQLNHNQVAKKLNHNKRNLTMTSSPLAESKSFDQQLLSNRAANASNNSDTDQLAANYDEKLKQYEKILRYSSGARKTHKDTDNFLSR